MPKINFLLTLLSDDAATLIFSQFAQLEIEGPHKLQIFGSATRAPPVPDSSAFDSTERPRETLLAIHYLLITYMYDIDSKCMKIKMKK